MDEGEFPVTKYKNLTALALLAALAACQSEAPETEPADAAEDTATYEDPQITNPDGFALESPVAGNAGAIPAAIQGRWGMVEADCEPGRADAKGLLVIDGDSLEFYESVGTVGEVAASDNTRIRASFDFTGEGMEWERDILLDVQDSGHTLIRREYGQDAAPDPFRYSKCS